MNMSFQCVCKGLLERQSYLCILPRFSTPVGPRFTIWAAATFLLNGEAAVADDEDRVRHFGLDNALSCPRGRSFHLLVVQYELLSLNLRQHSYLYVLAEIHRKEERKVLKALNSVQNSIANESEGLAHFRNRHCPHGSIFLKEPLSSYDEQ